MRLFFILIYPIVLFALVGCQTVPVERSDTVAPAALTSAEAPGSHPIASDESRHGRTGGLKDIDHSASSTHIEPAGYRSGDGQPPQDHPSSPESLSLPAAAEQTEVQPLTLADLEQMALTQNPAVSEASARVQALQGRYLQVGLPPNPTAGYTASEIGEEGKAGQQGAFIGQQFITGNKLGLNRNVAAQEVQKAERQFLATRQRVLTDVRIGYYELLIAQERLAMTEQLASTSRQAVDAVEALMKAKEASGVELLQAKVETDSANLLVETARAARLGAWQRLAVLVGNPEMPLMEVAGEARKDLPQVSFDSALDRVLAESPQLAATYSEIERARWALRRARAEVVPDIDVQASVQYDNGSQFTIAGVQMGLPIPIINRNQGGIQQAYGELLAAQRSANRVELALHKRFAAVHQQYTTARQQVDRYSEDILPKVSETLRLTTEGYRTGEFNFLQLLTVQRTYFQTNLAYLDALQQMWTASREIDGLLLSGSLEDRSTEQ